MNQSSAIASRPTGGSAADQEGVRPTDYAEYPLLEKLSGSEQSHDRKGVQSNERNSVSDQAY